MADVLIWLRILGLVASFVGWGLLAVLLLDRASRRFNLASQLCVFELGLLGLAGAYVAAVAGTLFSG